MSAQPAAIPALREATAPPERRGVARDGVNLLVTDRESGEQQQAKFYELPRFVKAGDLFVVNDSATLAAALRAHRANGEAIALHVSTAIDEHLWTVEPRGPVSAGEELALGDGARATMLAPVNEVRPRLWYARFVLPIPMHAFLAKAGEPIRYAYMKERFPLSDYQTVFARKPGSAEMPSAGRPFTERTVRDLRRAGARFATITLHCGVSSYEAPERPAPERYEVPAQTAQAVNAARDMGGRIIAVGTTVVRALESAVHDGCVAAASGFTDLVIEPGYQPQAATGLITGFHEPNATHVAMLRAFLRDDRLVAAYEEAAQGGYYLHEFGDIHAIL